VDVVVPRIISTANENLISDAQTSDMHYIDCEIDASETSITDKYTGSSLYNIKLPDSVVKEFGKKVYVISL
jgi:hypothetical protein